MSFKTWRARVRGPQDERLVAESNRIYAKGFAGLAFVCCMVFLYQTMLEQVSCVEEVPLYTNVGQRLLSPSLLLIAGMVAVCVTCLSLQCKKGFVDTGRFGEADRFAAEYYLACSGAFGAVLMLVMAGLRIVAEWQIVGFDNILWLPDLAVGAVFGMMGFALLTLAFYLTFLDAKRNRQKLLDD